MKDNNYLSKNVYSKESAFYFSFQKTGGERSNHWFILIVLSSLLLSSLRQQLVLVLCFYGLSSGLKVRILAHVFLQGVFRIHASHLFFAMVSK